METKDVIEIIFWALSIIGVIATVYFIATSAINAVKVGRELNNSQQKDNAKRNLFLKLFALRGSPSHYDFVFGLNQIDVVFEDTQTVLDAWHKLFDSLNNPSQTNAQKNWEMLRVDMLSAMAVSLGYSKIRQTDMIREYFPEVHEHKEQEDQDLRNAALVFLKSGSAISQLLFELYQKKDGGDSPNNEGND